MFCALALLVPGFNIDFGETREGRGITSVIAVLLSRLAAYPSFIRSGGICCLLMGNMWVKYHTGKYTTCSYLVVLLVLHDDSIYCFLFCFLA